MRKTLIIPFLLLLVITVAFGMFNFDLGISGSWYLTGIEWFQVFLGKGLSIKSPILNVSVLADNWRIVVLVVLILATLVTFGHTIGAYKKNKKTNRKGVVPKIGAVSIAIYIIAIVATAITLTYVLIGTAVLILISMLMVASMPNKAAIASMPAEIDVDESTQEQMKEIENELIEIENMDDHVYVQPNNIEEELFEEENFETLVSEQPTPAPEPIAFEQISVETVYKEETPEDLYLVLNNAKTHYQPYQPIADTNVIPFTETIANAKTHYQPYQPIAEPVVVAQPTPQPEPVVVAQPQPIYRPEPVVQEAQPILVSQPEPVVVAQPTPQPEPVVVAQPAPQPEPVVVAQPAPAPEPVVVAQPEPAPEPVVVVAPTPQPEPVVVVAPAPQPEPVIVVVPQPQPTPVVVIVEEPTPEERLRSTAERVQLLRQLTEAPDYSEEELYYHPKPKVVVPMNRQPFAKKVVQPQPAPQPVFTPEPVQSPVQNKPAPAPIVSNNKPSSKSDADAYREELKNKLLSKSN